MNLINNRQNEPASIAKLAAQRFTYTRAKKLFTWQVLITGPLSILLIVVGLKFQIIKYYAAILGLVIFLADLFIIEPTLKKLKKTAALIQEEFDCYVLQLTWNKIKGSKLDPYYIQSSHSKFGLDKKPDSLFNWYPEFREATSIEISRVICQRSNCNWDASQRRVFANILVVLLCVFVVAVFIAAKYYALSVEDFMLLVVIPALPLIKLLLTQNREHREALLKLENLKGHLEELWARTLLNPSDTTLATSSRIIQDEIFELRKRSPLVFDFIFSFLRSKLEGQMQFTSEHYESDALK